MSMLCKDLAENTSVRAIVDIEDFTYIGRKQAFGREVSIPINRAIPWQIIRFFSQLFTMTSPIWFKFRMQAYLHTANCKCEF